MAFNYNYNTGAGGTANPGNVYIQNIVWNFDKRTGKLRIEFDLRGLDWDTTDGNVVQAKIIYGGATKVTKTLYPQDSFIKNYIEWEPGKDAEDSTCQNLQNLGSISVTLRIEDENDSTTDYTKSIDVDLDPNEYMLTLVSPPSTGDDSTPDIVWSLKDLFSEQMITPVVTVGASTANSMTIYHEDGSTLSFNDGYVNLNGVKFSECSISFADTLPGNRTRWKRASTYKITAPTMSAGDNSFTIDLNCTTL